MRSGLAGHVRNDSITGSIGGAANANSPLASPREAAPGKVSRRNSGWGEVNEEDATDDTADDEIRKSKGEDA